MAVLTINFTFPGAAPANGFRLHYRAKNSTGAYTIHPSNFTSSPAIVSGVVAQDYEGFLEADCGEGVYSTAANFSTNNFVCPVLQSFPLSTGDGYIQVDNPIVYSFPPPFNLGITFVIIDTTTLQAVGVIDAVVDPSGTVLSPVPLKWDNLVNGRVYRIKASMKCNEVGSAVEIDIEVNSGAQTMWIADTYTCEQDAVFNLSSESTGFSSPAVAFYDEATGRVYVGDHDDPSGNIYYFNPNTFTGFADIVRVAGLTGVFYTVVVDKQYRRIYFVGKDSSGLVVFNMSDHSIQTVPYGVNGVNFNRVMVSVLTSSIYVHDRGQGTITIIDRATLTVSSTLNISSIPNAGLFDSFRLFQVGSELWVCSEFRTNGHIAVYNLALTAYITSITLTGIAAETSSRYRQNQYQDLTNDKFYVSDAGSSKLFVVDGASRTVVHTKTFTNRENKLFGGGNYVEDPITLELYLGLSCYNSPSDPSPTYRVYKINRTTYALEIVFPNQSFNSLTHQVGTQNIWGTFTGQPQWSGLAGYNTDGKILKYTR